MTYHITSVAGADYGTLNGDSPAAALLTLHRDAGYGPSVVWLDGDRLAFASEEDRELIGDADGWIIEEV